MQGSRSDSPPPSMYLQHDIPLAPPHYCEAPHLHSRHRAPRLDPPRPLRRRLHNHQNHVELRRGVIHRVSSLRGQECHSQPRAQSDRRIISCRLVFLSKFNKRKRGSRKLSMRRYASKTKAMQDSRHLSRTPPTRSRSVCASPYREPWLSAYDTCQTTLLQRLEFRSTVACVSAPYL
jgi:hypothetical protein